MGNANSNQHQNQHGHGHAGRRVQSPGRMPAGRNSSPAPSSATAASSTVVPESPSSTGSSNLGPHRSLRQKKKSLELPDLGVKPITPTASGSNTPVRDSSATRRSSVLGPQAARTSSPIPIPISPNVAIPGAEPRATRALPSHANIDDVLLPPPNNAQGQPGAGPRRSAHFRGAPLPYSSTRSFTTGGAPPTRPAPSRPIEHAAPAVAPRVRSNMNNPLDNIEYAVDGQRRRRVRPEPVAYKVKWAGHATSVVLARAGDDNWRGRQPMEKDPNKDVWFTTVHVLPGTHHVKFIVDDQWKVSDDYHKAVADDGSLANYIAIPIPAPTGFVQPKRAQGQPAGHPPPANMSFWSGGDDDGASITGYAPSDPRGWTDVIPPALVAAAAEEEAYLAAQEEHSQTSSEAGAQGGGPITPHIPPAPGLPRFLEKLILNTRPTGANIAGRDRTGERQRTRARDAAREQTGAHDGIPVTTASGTDISRSGMGLLGNAVGAMSPAHPPASMATSPGTPPLPSGQGSAAQPRRPANMPRLEVNLSPSESGHNTGSGGSGGYGGGGRPRSHSTAAPPVHSHGHGQSGSAGAVTAATDDSSVLPVPSHVTLHHLCTSAIRDGVLAVANTTRYRKKYLTTIYYKPTNAD